MQTLIPHTREEKRCAFNKIAEVLTRCDAVIVDGGIGMAEVFRETRIDLPYSLSIMPDDIVSVEFDQTISVVPYNTISVEIHPVFSDMPTTIEITIIFFTKDNHHGST